MIEYPVKKYVLFGLVTYYPAGGLEDAVGSFDTVEEANAYIGAQNGYIESWELVDRDTWKLVER